jgi:HK97 family phage portal protein
MSLISLNLSTPEVFQGKSTVGDVLDAQKVRADFDSNAPTGLPPMSDVEAWEDILVGLKTNTGQTVTPEKARRCSTVLAIMRGLSEDTACLTLPLMKRGDDEDTRAVNHPVDRLLNVAPNAIMTPLELREHMMFDMMLWGGFFNLINTSQDFADYGQIESLWPLQAGYVVRRWREMVWTFSDPTTGAVGSFTPDEVWRGSILSTNGIDGTAITLLCKEAIGLLLAAEEQGARLFSHGIQTDLAIETPNELNDEEVKQLRSAFMARHAGSRAAFLPMILQGGLKANKLGLTAQESQYLDARGFQVADIARPFRYPEVLLGSVGKSSKSSTYASAEQFFESYTKHTLGPWTIRIDQTGQRDLLTTKEQMRYYLEHDFSSLLKANETARIANWNAKIQGGWAQPKEARKAEKMSFKPGLDYFSTPAGSTGTAGAKPGPQSPDPSQTDQSASTLARRVAHHLLEREQKALVANKQDADAFYTNFGSYIERLTAANPDAIRSYLEGRRSLEDRFSIANADAALAKLTNLIQGARQ